MAMFTSYFEVSVNLNRKSKEKFITLISTLYSIYRALIRGQLLLCFLCESFNEYFNKVFRRLICFSFYVIFNANSALTSQLL